jgi:hypothetical protein
MAWPWWRRRPPCLPAVMVPPLASTRKLTRNSVLVTLSPPSPFSARHVMAPAWTVVLVSMVLHTQHCTPLGARWLSGSAPDRIVAVPASNPDYVELRQSQELPFGIVEWPLRSPKGTKRRIFQHKLRNLLHLTRKS